MEIGPPGIPDMPEQDTPSQAGPVVQDPPEAAGPASIEGTIRALLKGATNLANYFGADEDLPDQWRFTDDELALLVPALARWAWRVPKVRALVETGDAAVAIPVLLGYLTRNVIDGARARRARKDSNDDIIDASSELVDAGDAGRADDIEGEDRTGALGFGGRDDAPLRAGSQP